MGIVAAWQDYRKSYGASWAFGPYWPWIISPVLLCWAQMQVVSFWTRPKENGNFTLVCLCTKCESVNHDQMYRIFWNWSGLLSAQKTSFKLLFKISLLDSYQVKQIIFKMDKIKRKLKKILDSSQVKQIIDKCSKWAR